MSFKSGMIICEVTKEKDDIKTEEFLGPMHEYFCTEVNEEIPNVMFCTESEIKHEVQSCASSYQGEYIKEEHQNSDYILGLPRSDSVCKNVNQYISTNDQANSRLQSDNDERNRFECSICNKTFLELQFIRRHQKTCKNKAHKCSTCGKEFLSSMKLRAHELCHFDPPEIFECDISNKSISELNSVKAPKKPRKTIKPRNCATCFKEYLSPYELSAHTIYHFNPKTFECGICDETFSKLITLRRHVTEHHKKSYKCTVCSKTFSSPNDLSSHKEVDSKCKSLKCDVCNRSFLTLKLLNKHVSTHNQNKPYKCYPCGKAFLTPRELEKHELVHLNSGSWEQCGFCNKTFEALTYLKIHLQSHHAKPYKCTTCGNSFQFPSFLKEADQILKLNPNSFQCSICTKQFPNRTGLNKPNEIHSKQKKLPGYNLSKKSTPTTGLKEIVQLDSEEKRFKCKICGKAFATSFGLQCHNKYHS